MDSITRYHETRRRWPGIEMMMGTGNLTELTEADSLGVTALLVGMCSELAIRNVLIVQVSNHTRRTVEEHDAARRVMYAAKADAALPKGYGRGLLALHDKRPYVQTPDEIAAQAAEVRDPNYRIAVAEDGIHVFNRDVHTIGTDAMAFFPELDVASDGAHAFYLGGELTKAETAWRLGKRYVQDEALAWGAAADAEVEDTTAFKKAGHTKHSGPEGARNAAATPCRSRPGPPRLRPSSPEWCPPRRSRRRHRRGAPASSAASSFRPGRLEAVPLILETVVTTSAPDGALHLVPFGLIQEGADWILAPFRPSPTILNLAANPVFAASSPSDVRVIAGAVTGRRDWATTPCERIAGRRLAESFGHAEFEVIAVEDDAVRPRYRGGWCTPRRTCRSSATTGRKRRCWRRRSSPPACTCWTPTRS